MEKRPVTERQQYPEYKIEVHQFMLCSIEVSFSMSSPDHAQVCQFVKSDYGRSYHDKSLAATPFLSISLLHSSSLSRPTLSAHLSRLEQLIT
jgi:hypothetical protein